MILGAIMSILDTTIVNVALRTLGEDLDAPLASIQWVLTGYMLSLAAVIPITGWAARRFGPRNVYMLSLVLFTAGSMLCGLATSVGELTFFRVLQGIGGGMLLPIGQLMMANAAGPQRMGRVMSVVAIPAMLAPILGPALGGVIVDNLSWRWIFYVNVPIGIVALVAALRILPKGDRSPAGRLDVRGLALMSTGLPLLTYGLAEIGATGHFLVPRVLVPLFGGIALIVAFVFHALRVTNPLLDLRLYRRATFAAASGTHVPARRRALRRARPAAALLAGGSRRERRLHRPPDRPDGDRDGARDAARRQAHRPLRRRAARPDRRLDHDDRHDPVRADRRRHLDRRALGAMVVRGVGVGLAFIPAMTAAYASLNRSELPDAAPQLNVLQRVGGSIGTAVLAVVLQRALAGAISPSEMAAAFGTAFWWTTGITAIAIVPCFLLMRAERAAKRDALADADRRRSRRARMTTRPSHRLAPARRRSPTSARPSRRRWRRFGG